MSTAYESLYVCPRSAGVDFPHGRLLDSVVGSDRVKTLTTVNHPCADGSNFVRPDRGVRISSPPTIRGTAESGAPRVAHVHEFRYPLQIASTIVAFLPVLVIALMAGRAWAKERMRDHQVHVAPWESGDSQIASATHATAGRCSEDSAVGVVSYPTLVRDTVAGLVRDPFPALPHWEES